MSEEERFEAWLDKVCQKSLPIEPIERVYILARELADGALNELWDSVIFAPYMRTGDSDKSGYIPQTKALNEYLVKRWDDNYPSLRLLEQNGLLDQIDKSNFSLNPNSFALTRIPVSTSIFISYRRKDSSAFALLILKELKTAGLEAFLDLSLIAGENWHAGLKERIQQYDTFIVILGKETLHSEYVVKEIGWAIEAASRIIPVWHNEFEYKPEDWANLPPEINQLLQNNHTIRVLEESASGYNAAIDELLNKFGVTP